MIVEGKVYIVLEKDYPHDPVYEVFGRESDYIEWYRDYIKDRGREAYEERFKTEFRTVNFSVNVEINQ